MNATYIVVDSIWAFLIKPKARLSVTLLPLHKISVLSFLALTTALVTTVVAKEIWSVVLCTYIEFWNSIGSPFLFLKWSLCKKLYIMLLFCADAMLYSKKKKIPNFFCPWKYKKTVLKSCIHTLDSGINVAPGITVAPLLEIFTSWF